MAARLESLADAGGICISESVRTAIGKKLPYGYEFMGEQQVKNIEEPVRAYAVLLDSGKAQVSPPANPTPELPGKPSIAVLPFTNMSSDPEQEVLADGITEDIITELSRFRSLFVIARNSSFTYKGRVAKVQEIGRELGVQYVVEGSVRRAGNRVRRDALVDARGQPVQAGQRQDLFRTGPVGGAGRPRFQFRSERGDGQVQTQCQAPGRHRIECLDGRRQAAVVDRRLPHDRQLGTLAALVRRHQPHDCVLPEPAAGIYCSTILPGNDRRHRIAVHRRQHRQG